MRRLLVLSLLALGACRSADLHESLGSETVLAFEGVRAFTEKELLTAIDADRFGVAGRRASRAQVDDAAYAIEELYRTSGFAQASVSYEHEETAEGVRVRFLVEEGPRLWLESVSFSGNDGLDSETLALFFLPDPGAETPFVRARTRSAVSGIEGYYYQKGWLRMRVLAVEERAATEEGLVELAVRIEEGPRSLLRSVELAFTSDAEELVRARKALERAAAARRDRPYAPPIAYGLRAALLEALGNSGRPDAVVTFEAQFDPDTGDVHLAYRVEPGPLVTIGAVRVEGAAGNEGLVRERLELATGDAWDASKVRKSFANLYRSGLFRSVTIDLSDEPGTSTRELLVHVEEVPSMEIFMQPGYGSYEGARLTFGVDERNVLGSGTGLRLESTVGFLAQGATLAWTDPWVKHGLYETRVALSADHREEPAFTETEVGTELSLARLWKPGWRSTLSYSFRRSALDDVELEPDDPLLEDALEDANVAALALSTTIDDRDILFTPREGGRRRASVEWAAEVFGSEVDYVGGNLELSQFYELFDETVLGLRLLTGVKQPVAETESLPLQERFYNGGENTVRSFAEDELGPSDASGDPAGGEAFNVWNIELRQTLVGHLEAGLFFDAGNVTSEVEDYLRFEDVRTGLGTGLRYLLPIGPVRLDVAWNPTARDEEDDFVVHLAIGMAF